MKCNIYTSRCYRVYISTTTTPTLHQNGPAMVSDNAPDATVNPTICRQLFHDVLLCYRDYKNITMLTKKTPTPADQMHCTQKFHKAVRCYFGSNA